MSQQIEYVYLIHCQGRYKIGVSRDPQNRLESLGIKRTGKVVHAFEHPQPYQCEKVWHKRFKHKNIGGEWFRLSGSDVEEFVRVGNEIPVPVRQRPTYPTVSPEFQKEMSLAEAAAECGFSQVTISARIKKAEGAGVQNIYQSGGRGHGSVSSRVSREFVNQLREEHRRAIEEMARILGHDGDLKWRDKP